MMCNYISGAHFLTFSLIPHCHMAREGSPSRLKKTVGGLNGFGPVFTLKTHDLRFLRNGTSDRNEKRGPLL